MAVRFGHPDVLVSNTSGSKFTEENVACNGKTGASIPVARLAFSFLSQNLVDSRLDGSRSPEYLTLPDLRAVLEDGGATNGPRGETVDGSCFEIASLSGPDNGSGVIQRGGATFPAVAGSVQNLVAGLPAPLLGSIVPNDPATLANPAMKAFTGPDAGRIVPLTSAFGSDRALFGTPTVHLNIAASIPLLASDLNPPKLFIGLVRQTADGGQQLVHDQVQSVKGYGAHDITLPGVSMLLHGSDRLALVVFGYHPQYFGNFTKVPVAVNVTGIQAGLPFVN